MAKKKKRDDAVTHNAAENPAEKEAEQVDNGAPRKKTKKKKKVIEETEHKPTVSIAENDAEQVDNGGSQNKERKKKKKKKNKESKDGCEETERKPTVSTAETDAKQVDNGDSQKKKKDSKYGCEETKQIPTVSIAVAGSIINNAQSYELATRLAGQIARAATIFRIDEVIVFDSKSDSEKGSRVVEPENSDAEENGSAFLVRILQYLETPQYLRKALFPWHNSLKFVGLLPPLDAPHHLRKHEWGSYREGVTLKEQAPNSLGTLVDVGLHKSIVIDQVLPPGTRVTVAMGSDRNLNSDSLYKIVPSSQPREAERTYWGYKVRYASNLSAVVRECPYKGGYDHLIGTSEHGLVVKSSELVLPTFRHLLISFGGLAGLEESAEEDTKLKGKDVRTVFHSYLNTCPNQGSRTIRTEEAIFISLQYFQEPITRALEGES